MDHYVLCSHPSADRHAAVASTETDRQTETET